MGKNKKRGILPYLDDEEKLTIETYRQIYYRLERLATSCLRYYRLPTEIEQMVIEYQLYHRGNSVFFYDDILERYLTLPISARYSFDEYGLPTEYEVMGWRDYRKRLNIDNSVIIYNDFQMLPTAQLMQIFASRLTNCLRVSDMHLEGQKIGNIVSVPMEQKRSVEEVIKKIKNFGLWIITSPAQKDLYRDAQQLRVQDEYYGDRIDEHYTFLWNQVLSYLGIASMAEKKSGVNRLETMVDASISEVNKNAILWPRKVAVNKINEMFDLDIDVEYVNTNIMLGGDQNGRIHNVAQDSIGNLNNPENGGNVD